MTSKLKVMSVRARDVLGITEFAMEPGKVTLLSGRNGTGKTSAIELLESIFGGGNLAKIARIDPSGEEVEPEIVVVMDTDEGQRYLIKKNEKGIKVKKQVGDTQGFDDVPKPQRFLSGLYDGKLANPIEFLNAPDKERVLMLLGALPLQLDRDGLWQKLGLKKSELSPIPEGLHPLQELALIREAIFRERTGVNRDAKAKAGSDEQTRRNTPAVLPDDHEQEINQLEQNISHQQISYPYLIIQQLLYHLFSKPLRYFQKHADITYLFFRLL